MSLEPTHTLGKTEAFRVLQQFTLPVHAQPLTQFLELLAERAAEHYDRAHKPNARTEIIRAHEAIVTCMNALVADKVDFTRGTLDERLMNMSRDNVLRAITDFRANLPAEMKKELPERWFIVAGIDEMLHRMENPILYHEEYHANRVTRMRDAAERARPSRALLTWDGTSEKRSPSELSLNAARRQTAYVTLVDFKLSASPSRWIDTLTQRADIARSQWRMGATANTKKQETQLSGLLNDLDAGLKNFSQLAANDTGSDLGAAQMRGILDLVFDTVEKIRTALPEEARGGLPSPEQYAQHRDRLLTRIRNAVAQASPRALPDSGSRGR